MEMEQLLLYQLGKKDNSFIEKEQGNSFEKSLSDVWSRCLEMEDISVGERERVTQIYSKCVGYLIELAIKHKWEGNIWQAYLTHILITSENGFTKACERKGDIGGSLHLVAKHDLAIYKYLFSLDFSLIDNFLQTNIGHIVENFSQKQVSCEEKTTLKKAIETLVKKLASENVDGMYTALTKFYQIYGVGEFGLHKAFRLEEGEHNKYKLQPIDYTSTMQLSDLIGYEAQKKKLLDNTIDFIQGRKANNVLLFGDAGTGKSSCIKSMLNQFYEQGLRIIEVYKHQFKDLSRIISQIKHRNYKFIIYMDDLSFEEFEVEYKYLKAIIEGGLEECPNNVLIYATSNRRHLIKESFNDTKDFDIELHKSDTVEEKLSLVARFGVTIYFSAPDKKQFQTIVRELAKREEIVMDEETLFLEANKWELSHGGLSGRCAKQFVTYLKGQYSQ